MCSIGTRQLDGGRRPVSIFSKGPRDESIMLSNSVRGLTVCEISDTQNLKTEMN